MTIGYSVEFGHEAKELNSFTGGERGQDALLCLRDQGGDPLEQGYALRCEMAKAPKALFITAQQAAPLQPLDHVADRGRIETGDLADFGLIDAGAESQNRQRRKLDRRNADILARLHEDAGRSLLAAAD